jgi:hypothetical protein
MAVKSLYFKNVTANGALSLQDGGTAPATGLSTTGWGVGKTAASNYSLMSVGAKSSTWSTTEPLATANFTAASCFRTEQPLSGKFANTNWTFAFRVRAATASSQAGAVRIRVWKSTVAAGTGATQLTSAVLVGTTTAALSTSASATSTVTWATPGAITLNNEYLWVQCEWQITTASGSNNGDSLFYIESAGVITTPDFVAAAVGTGALTPSYPNTRTNMVPQSQAFDNAAWQKLAVSVSPNSINAPDGTLTAELVTAQASFNPHYVSPGGMTFPGGPVTLSIYATPGNSNWLQISFPSNAFANFNLSGAGSLGSNFDSSTATITNVGGGWYRCTMTVPSAITAGSWNPSYAITQPDPASASPAYTATNESVFLWGAQIEPGSTATEYIPTTTAAVTVVSGVIVGTGTVTSLPATGTGTLTTSVATITAQGVSSSTGTGALIILQARYNIAKRSEELDQTPWFRQNVTTTVDAAMAPNSTMTADRLNDGTAYNQHYAGQTFNSSAAGETHTCSIYAKAETLSWFQLQAGTNVYANFNVATGVVGLTGSLVIAANIEAVGNGWYRCSLSAPLTSNASAYVMLLNADVAPVAPNYTNYQGNNSTMLFWGLQVEFGNVLTSYIPTTSDVVVVGQGGPSLTAVGRMGWSGSGALDVSANREPMGRSIPYTANFGNATTTPQLGQSFVTTADQLNSIGLCALTLGSPTDGVYLQVYNEALPATVRGQPSDIIAVRGTTPTYYKFTFNPPISLVPGNTYSFAIARTGAIDTSNYYRLRNDGNVYAGGTLLRLSSSTWSADVSYDTAGWLDLTANYSRITGVGEVSTSAGITGTGTLACSTSAFAASGISGSSNAPGSTPVPDIVIEGGDGGTLIFGGINYGAAAEGQAFIATGTSVTKVTAKLCKYGAPTDNLRCRISTAGADYLPIALLGTTIIPASSLPLNTVGPVDFTFATPVAVSKDQLYHVAIDRTGAADDSNLFATAMTYGRVYEPSYSYDRPGGGEIWELDAASNLVLTISQMAGAAVPPLQVASSTLAGTGFAGSSLVTGTGALVAAQAQLAGTGFAGSQPTEAIGTGALVAAQAQVTGVGTASSVGGGVIPTAGLICHWKLSDGSGTDLSGSNNHGVFVEGVTPSSDGPMGNAAVFDGTTGRVELGGTQPLNLDYFSHSVWVKTTQTISGNIVGFANGWASGTSDHTLMLVDGGNLAFYVYAGAVNVLTGTKPINDGQWHHIVGTLGPVGAPGGGGQKIYIDGVLHLADVNVTNGAYPYYDRPNVYLGGIVGAFATNFVKGSFADLLIYNRPLTAAEVAAIYAADSGELTPATGTGTLASSGSALASTGLSSSIGVGVLPAPPVSAEPAGAIININFIAKTGFVQGTGSVGIETLIGYDPVLDSMWGPNGSWYDPTALGPYGYDYQWGTTDEGVYPPAFIGALKTATLNGKSVVVTMQQKPGDATNGNADWRMYIITADRSRQIWFQTGDGYLESGSYNGYIGLEDVWQYDDAGSKLNAFGFTIAKSAHWDLAANNLKSDTSPLTDVDTPPAKPLSGIGFDAWGPIASITVYDTLSMAALQAKTVPALQATGSGGPAYVCTLAASGTTGSVATGTLAAGLSSLAGTGLVASAGTGALASPASAAAGSGISRSVATSAALQASLSVLAGAEGVSNVTGTGDARSQSSSLSGAGVAASTGTGALASNGAALAGGGLSQSTGTSLLAAQAAAIVGSGIQIIQGTGALACGASSIAGLGLPLWAGSGAVAAAASALTGSGVSRWLGDGTLAAAASGLSGAGVSSSTATAALAASRSSVFGAEGVVVITGTGSLVAQSHTVAAAGLGGSSGAGVLAAPAHVLDGEAVSQSRGLAVLQGSTAAASGDGISGSLGAGDLTSNATMAGAGTAQHQGSGALAADVAKLDGAAISRSVGSGDLVSANAAADGAGESSVKGVAVLASAPAHLAGFADLTSSGTGVLVAADHLLDAVGIVQATGYGSLPAHRASLDGTGSSEGYGTGMLVSRRALMLGFGEVESRIEGQGDLTSRIALLRGFGEGLSFGQGVLAARSSSLIGLGGLTTGSGDLKAGSSAITGSGGVDLFGDWVPVALPPSYPGTAPWHGAAATWKGATATWINPGTGQWRNPGTVTPPWPRRAA